MIIYSNIIDRALEAETTSGRFYLLDEKLNTANFFYLALPNSSRRFPNEGNFF